MTIPSYDEFRSAIRLIDESDLGYMREAYTPNLFSKDNRRQARMLVEDAILACNRRYQRVFDEAAVVWLLDQGTVGNLVLWRGSNLRSFAAPCSDSVFSEAVARWVDQLEEFALPRQSGQETPRSNRLRLLKFKRYLNSLLGTGPGSVLVWLRLVLEALSEYFYDAESVDQILRARRQLRVLIPEISVGSAALSRLSRDRHFAYHLGKLLDLGLINCRRSDGSLIDMATIADELVILEESLRRALELVMPNTYPILRHDATAKERLLVVRLTRANTALWGGRRVGVTMKLLEIEGIASTFDQRTVERIAALPSDRHLQEELRRVLAGRFDDELRGTVAGDETTTGTVRHR